MKSRGSKTGLLARLAHELQPVAGALPVRAAGGRPLARPQRVAHLYLRGALAPPGGAPAGLGGAHVLPLLPGAGERASGPGPQGLAHGTIPLPHPPHTHTHILSHIRTLTHTNTRKLIWDF